MLKVRFSICRCLWPKGKDCPVLLAHADRGTPKNLPLFCLVGGDESHTEVAAGRTFLHPHLVRSYGPQGIPQLPPGWVIVQQRRSDSLLLSLPEVSSSSEYYILTACFSSWGEGLTGPLAPSPKWEVRVSVGWIAQASGGEKTLTLLYLLSSSMEATTLCHNL